MGRPKKRRHEEDETQKAGARKSHRSPRAAAPTPTLNDLALAHELGFDDYAALSHTFRSSQMHGVPVHLDPALRTSSTNPTSPYPPPNMEAWHGIQACELVQHDQAKGTDSARQPSQQQPSPPHSNEPVSDAHQSAHVEDFPMDPGPPCACLSTMYLSLSTLSGLRTFHFPHVLSPIRSSLSVASSVVDCPHCPRETSMMLQNTGVLQTLLSSICDRMFRALKEIEAEAERLVNTDTRKPCRIGDSSPGSQHLHDGTPDCPAAFMIELSGPEWKRFARRAIQGEAGKGPGRPRERTLLGVIDRMKERQEKWHKDPSLPDKVGHLYTMPGASDELQMEPGVKGKDCGPEDYDCLKQLTRVAHMVDRMGFDD